MDHLFCIRYSRLFGVYHQKNEIVNDNPPIRIYVNKIENKITFKIKTGYYLELSTLETIMLLGSTKKKMTKDEKWWKMYHI